MPGIKWETEEYSLFLEDERFYPAKQQLEEGLWGHCGYLPQQAA